MNIASQLQIIEGLIQHARWGEKKDNIPSEDYEDTVAMLEKMQLILSGDIEDREQEEPLIDLLPRLVIEAATITSKESANA